MEKEPKIELPKPISEHAESIYNKLDFFLSQILFVDGLVMI